MALALAAHPAAASAPEPDTTVAGRARGALRRLEVLETSLAVRSDTTDLAARARQRELLLAARAVLDTAIVRAPDGRRTLAALQREYPGAAILREYEGLRLLADGDPAGALRLFEGLLRAQRRNVPLLRGRARALDALGRAAEAEVAWGRVLDASPADEDAFEVLFARHARAGTLPAFHRTVQRLRLLEPDDPVILGREVRLLQAMGLPDSAAAVAQRFQRGGP